MLVVLDCLLFREEAYRHLFWHRYRDLQLETRESKGMLLLACSCLRAYVASLARVGSPEDDFIPFAVYWMQQSILSGVVYYMHIGCIALSLFLSTKWTNEYARLLSSRAPEELSTQIYLSMLLPSACHGATIFVQIWEDSDTVRTMGSCLVLAYQWFALHTIFRTDVGSVSQTLTFTILFVLSLMMRDVVLELARSLLFVIGDDEMPATLCAGLELKIGSLWLLPFASHALEIPPICLA